jgi:hypothetical protein
MYKTPADIQEEEEFRNLDELFLKKKPWKVSPRIYPVLKRNPVQKITQISRKPELIGKPIASKFPLPQLVE